LPETTWGIILASSESDRLSQVGVGALEREHGQEDIGQPERELSFPLLADEHLL
jgi:hypothetical protein